MTDLQKDRVYSWELPPCTTARRRNSPPRVNISERIRDMSIADRRAVFQALKTDQPQIAELVTNFHNTFGPLDLCLDPETARRVLAAAEVCVNEGS